MQVFPLRTVEGLALSLAKPYKNKERNTCGSIPPHYLLIAQKMGANYSVCSINMELSFKLTVIE